MVVHTLTHHAHCGMSITLLGEQDQATREEARTRAARRLRRLRREGFPVTVLSRGTSWEIGEPEGCCLIPDDAGILSLDSHDPLARKYGACRECGYSDGWQEGGRGEVFCGCQIADEEECEQCEECGSALEAYRAGKCDSCIAADDREHDAAEFRRKGEAFDQMARDLRECFPSSIPDDWTR